MILKRSGKSDSGEMKKKINYKLQKYFYSLKLSVFPYHNINYATDMLIWQ
jgi:hypothetical protein